MLTLKSSAQVRTCGHVRSFRSVANSTGISLEHLDRARLQREWARLAAREARRLSLKHGWEFDLEISGSDDAAEAARSCSSLGDVRAVVPPTVPPLSRLSTPADLMPPFASSSGPRGSSRA